jgi:hypothetical protein
LANRLKIELFFLFALILSCGKLSSQNNTDFFVDSTQQLNVSVGMDFTYGSTVMNNEFLNKFLFGGKIDRELKDKAYTNLGGNNRLGGDLNYKATVEIPFDTIFGKSDISMVIGVEANEHIDGAFSSDLFRFTFDGNKQFAGESASLDGINYNYYKIQRLNLGFINHKIFDNGIAKEGAIISIIKGEEQRAITIPRGSIFTEQNGREIDVDLNYLYNSSDTANKGFMAFNGMGISTDLFTEFFLKNGDKIYMGIEDLGFVYWNKSSLEITTDSVFHYEGVFIDNIFDLNDSLIDNLSKDSIINSISTTNEKGDYSVALPTAIHLTYTKIFNDKWKANIGFYGRILSNYFPYIYANIYHYFNSSFAIKSQLAYGGYGKINVGVALSKNIKNSFNIFIGTNNIDALVAPVNSYSSSGFLGVKKYF